MRDVRVDWPRVALVLGLAAVGGGVVIFAPVEYRAVLVPLLTMIVGALRSYLDGSAAEHAHDAIHPIDEEDRRD